MRASVKSGYGFALENIKLSNLIQFCREHMSTILLLSNSVSSDQKTSYDNLIAFVYSNKATSENIELECTSFAKIKDAYGMANPLSIIPAIITEELHITMSLQPYVTRDNLKTYVVLLLDDAPWMFNLTERSITSTIEFDSLLRPYMKTLFNDDSNIATTHYDVVHLY